MRVGGSDGGVIVVISTTFTCICFVFFDNLFVCFFTFRCERHSVL